MSATMSDVKVKKSYKGNYKKVMVHLRKRVKEFKKQIDKEQEEEMYPYGLYGWERFRDEPIYDEDGFKVYMGKHLRWNNVKIDIPQFRMIRKGYNDLYGCSDTFVVVKTFVYRRFKCDEKENIREFLNNIQKWEEYGALYDVAIAKDCRVELSLCDDVLSLVRDYII